MEDPDERIPLIQVFQHPWVLFFQQKFFAYWQPNESDEDEGEEEEEETSSDAEDDDEEEDEDEDELDEPNEDFNQITPEGNSNFIGGKSHQHKGQNELLQQ